MPFHPLALHVHSGCLNSNYILWGHVITNTCYPALQEVTYGEILQYNDNSCCVIFFQTLMTCSFSWIISSPLPVTGEHLAYSWGYCQGNWLQLQPHPFDGRISFKDRFCANMQKVWDKGKWAARFTLAHWFTVCSAHDDCCDRLTVERPWSVPCGLILSFAQRA